MRRERKAGPDLRGVKVLVIEDEFYLAAELEEQVQQGGGTVLGPCPDVPAAMTQMDAGPSCAVVDINLGQGPSFEIAGVLRARGIPFLFLTGYDMEVIPPEFADIECLQKPIDTSRAMDAIARLTTQ
jgi:DNA-binding response OmpR family regulator